MEAVTSAPNETTIEEKDEGRKMKWFVIWISGNCNEGSCNCNWQSFGSKDEAMKKVIDLEKSLDFDKQIIVVEGEQVH